MSSERKPSTKLYWKKVTKMVVTVALGWCVWGGFFFSPLLSVGLGAGPAVSLYCVPIKKKKESKLGPHLRHHEGFRSLQTRNTWIE